MVLVFCYHHNSILLLPVSQKDRDHFIDYQLGNYNVVATWVHPPGAAPKSKTMSPFLIN
jgi:hypothetical protein